MCTEAANERAQLRRYYDVADLRHLLKKGRTAVYTLINDQAREDPFPLPLIIGKSYLWPAVEVDDWLARQPRGLKTKHTARTHSRTAAAVRPGTPNLITTEYRPARGRYAAGPAA